MQNTTTRDAAQAVLTFSSPLRNPADLDPLLERIGDARYVLLGEASHGTHDYYRWRALISQRLITEKGFDFVAVEGDWPDCFRVNQYARGRISAPTAVDVLRDFARWPTWMWANWEVAAFIEWLTRFNAGRPEDDRVGFYGLDVYSLHESLEAIVGYLQEHHPEALPAAQRAFRCFEAFGDDPQEYALATRLVPRNCEDDVVRLLSTVRERAGAIGPGQSVADLDAEMNAWVVVNAEEYYRQMLGGGAVTWNLRDRHMAETLERLMRFHGPRAKAIVWEHNTHIGDARYTDMAADGMFNLGQLVREEKSSDGVVLAGFGSYAGSVIAGSAWGAPMEKMTVPPAQPGSWEAELHALNAEDRLLLFRPPAARSAALAQPRGNRAIGVVYRPEAEWGNYVPTVLPLRYDAFMYIDRTEALHPLHITPTPETPELYPWGV
ncbi:MAG: erythromycin esterase family protein [Thermomicrobiales bacterium]|nr:erythromycin esterase family protein [Thermomicrobiales bacterium]